MSAASTKIAAIIRVDCFASGWIHKSNLIAHTMVLYLRLEIYSATVINSTGLSQDVQSLWICTMTGKQPMYNLGETCSTLEQEVCTGFLTALCKGLNCGI